MHQIPTLTAIFVRLEPLTLDHVTALWEASQYDEIWSYMPCRPHSLDEMRAMIDEFTSAPYLAHAMPFAIIETATNRVVGSTQILDIDWAHKGAEIGWTWLTPSLWRTPVNSQCKLLLLGYCFDTLGLIRVTLKTDSRNERSQRAIERLGAVREGVLRKHRILPDGYIRDSVYYSIVSEEWPSVRERLETYLNTAAYVL